MTSRESIFNSSLVINKCSDQFYAFDLTREGRLIPARGLRANDAVLINDAKKLYGNSNFSRASGSEKVARTCNVWNSDDKYFRVEDAERNVWRSNESAELIALDSRRYTCGLPSSCRSRGEK